MLAGITLEVTPGRVTGLVGPNEAGKSTLCLVASGLAPASIGGRLDGLGDHGRDRDPVAEAARAGAALRRALPEPDHAALRHGRDGLRGDGLRAAQPGAVRSPEVVDPGRVRRSAMLGIEALAPRDPARLSGGQAQLVALASVLALRPAYLVLDEPTSQLDPLGTRLVGEALARPGRRDRHGSPDRRAQDRAARGLADEVVVIDGGRAGRSRDRPAAILADPRLAALGIEPPAAVRLRSGARGRGARSRRCPAGRGARPGRGSRARRRWAGGTSRGPGPSGRRGEPGVSIPIAVESVVFVYPDGTRALDGVDLAIDAGRAGRDRRARTGPASPRWSASSTACCGRPRGACWWTARRHAGRHVAQLAAKVGLAFQNPDRQIFAGRVRAEVGVRAAEPGRARGRPGPRGGRGARRRWAWPTRPTHNPYDLGYSRRKLLAMASILAMATPVVILDEPTTGQDAARGRAGAGRS